MSSSPPLIGLTGHRKAAGAIPGFPKSSADFEADVYLADYSRAVIEAGGLPVNIPIDVDVELLIGRLDGVLLSGGTDVDPAIYGADPHEEVLDVEPARDELELELYRQAIAHDVPVLGICRGLQLINTAHGGTLNQHVPTHSRSDVDYATGAHGVRVEESSILASLYGPSLEVNSLHHQTVDRLGSGLVATAWSDDGEVEGVELENKMIAVQWHPELLAGRAHDPLFRWLVDVAAQSRR